MNKTNEQAFEALIEKALVGTTLEERQQTGVNDIDAQSPDYIIGGCRRICPTRSMLLICVVCGRS